MTDKSSPSVGLSPAWIIPVVLVAAMVAGYLWLLQNRDAIPSTPSLPELGYLPEFTGLDQEGKPFRLLDQRGEVLIAKFIFSTCPGPCFRMTQEMHGIQEELEASEPIRLLSFTVDPEYDRPPILKAYGERMGVDFSRWTLVTGEKDEVYNLVQNGFKLPLAEVPEGEVIPEDGPIVHSSRFVLVDRAGVIRGYYDGFNAEQKAELIKAARHLANSPRS